MWNTCLGFRHGLAILSSSINFSGTRFVLFARRIERIGRRFILELRGGKSGGVERKGMEGVEKKGMEWKGMGEMARFEIGWIGLEGRVMGGATGGCRIELRRFRGCCVMQ